MGTIAVGVGPGSYTGVRIGIATAKALAGALGIPARGGCTLDARARRGGGLDPGRPCLALIDARRGEVFAALYGPTGERAWEPFVAAPRGLAARLSQLPAAPLGVGSGALRFRDELADALDIPAAASPVHRISAEKVCELAASAAAGPPEPIYLRAPDAERWRERNP